MRNFMGPLMMVLALLAGSSAWADEKATDDVTTMLEAQKKAPKLDWQKKADELAKADTSLHNIVEKGRRQVWYRRAILLVILAGLVACAQTRGWKGRLAVAGAFAVLGFGLHVFLGT